jgi:hypothetical protein
MQFQNTRQTCSIETRTCGMDEEHGHAASTCSMDVQHVVHKAWAQHGHAARIFSIDMRHDLRRGHAEWGHGYAALRWKCSTDMDSAWTRICSMSMNMSNGLDMQHWHGHEARQWTMSNVYLEEIVSWYNGQSVLQNFDFKKLDIFHEIEITPDFAKIELNFAKYELWNFAYISLTTSQIKDEPVAVEILFLLVCKTPQRHII